MIKKSMGRPPKITYRTLATVADKIQRNYSVTDACQHVNISRDSFYRYLNNEPEFTEMITKAYENQSKVPMSFLATY